MGGTFDNGTFGSVCAVSTSSRLWWVERCACWGECFSGAHCWVLKAQTCGACDAFCGVVFWLTGITRVGGVGGTDRTLRTTQWTRASSEISPIFWVCSAGLGTHRGVASVFGVVLVVCVFSLFLCDFQVAKSKRWMPGHLEPKKDVVICDKPRGVDKRAVIRGCPNGETPPGRVRTW